MIWEDRALKIRALLAGLLLALFAAAASAGTISQLPVLGTSGNGTYPLPDPGAATAGNASVLWLEQNCATTPLACDFQVLPTQLGYALQQTTAPASPSKLQPWWNTAVSGFAEYELYDGTSWVPDFWIDTTNHLFVGQIGGGQPQTLAGNVTVDLCAVPVSSVTISGTASISSFGSTCPAGIIKYVTFSGASTLVYNATNLILPGAANIVTTAGDVATVQALGSGNYQVVGYQTAATFYGNFAPLNSPHFTGVPTAPTPAAGTNTTQLATTAFVTAAIPALLTSNLTLYVTPSGVDAGSCPSTAPCLTAQYAANQALNNYNENGFNITIQFSTGTYTAGATVNGLITGQRSPTGLTFQGNTGLPDNVVFNCSATCFRGTGGAQFTVQGVKMSVSGTGNAVQAESGAFLFVGFDDFGVMTSGSHISNAGGVVYLTGSYSITGGAIDHLSGTGGITEIEPGLSPIVITCVGSPVFSGAFASVSLPSTIQYPSTQVSFSGCSGVTGQRYACSLNGVINTGGAGSSFFPGNSTASCTSGGQYSDNQSDPLSRLVVLAALGKRGSAAILDHRYQHRRSVVAAGRGLRIDFKHDLSSLARGGEQPRAYRYSA